MRFRFTTLQIAMAQYDAMPVYDNPSSCLSLRGPQGRGNPGPLCPQKAHARVASPPVCTSQEQALCRPLSCRTCAGPFPVARDHTHNRILQSMRARQTRIPADVSLSAGILAFAGSVSGPEGLPNVRAAALPRAARRRLIRNRHPGHTWRSSVSGACVR